jgi:hypothetical protein
MREFDTSHPDPAPVQHEVPDWDDDYLDRVSDRLLSNFDMSKHARVGSYEFDLYGRMVIKNQKEFFHPALRYGYHESTEHLLVQRRPDATVADVEEFEAFAHALADDWIVDSDDHFETIFTFVLVVPEVREDVRDYVADYYERPLLKYGFNGHYQIKFVVVSPETETLVASEEADVWRAFQLWANVDDSLPDGVLGRIKAKLLG